MLKYSTMSKYSISLPFLNAKSSTQMAPRNMRNEKQEDGTPRGGARVRVVQEKLHLPALGTESKGVSISHDLRTNPRHLQVSKNGSFVLLPDNCKLPANISTSKKDAEVMTDLLQTERRTIKEEFAANGSPNVVRTTIELLQPGASENVTLATWTCKVLPKARPNLQRFSNLAMNSLYLKKTEGVNTFQGKSKIDGRNSQNQDNNSTTQQETCTEYQTDDNTFGQEDQKDMDKSLPVRETDETLNICHDSSFAEHPSQNYEWCAEEGEFPPNIPTQKVFSEEVQEEISRNALIACDVNGNARILSGIGDDLEDYIVDSNEKHISEDCPNDVSTDKKVSESRSVTKVKKIRHQHFKNISHVYQFLESSVNKDYSINDDDILDAISVRKTRLATGGMAFSVKTATEQPSTMQKKMNPRNTCSKTTPQKWFPSKSQVTSNKRNVARKMNCNPFQVEYSELKRDLSHNVSHLKPNAQARKSGMSSTDPPIIPQGENNSTSIHKPTISNFLNGKNKVELDSENQNVSKSDSEEDLCNIPRKESSKVTEPLSHHQHPRQVLTERIEGTFLAFECSKEDSKLENWNPSREPDQFSNNYNSFFMETSLLNIARNAPSIKRRQIETIYAGSDRV